MSEEKPNHVTRNVLVSAFTVAVAGGMGLTLWNSAVAWGQDASAAHIIALENKAQLEKNQPLIDGLDVQNERLGNVEGRLGAIEEQVDERADEVLKAIRALK